jgi:hypothetical protein
MHGEMEKWDDHGEMEKWDDLQLQMPNQSFSKQDQPHCWQTRPTPLLANKTNRTVGKPSPLGSRALHYSASQRQATGSCKRPSERYTNHKSATLAAALKGAL